MARLLLAPASGTSECTAAVLRGAHGVLRYDEIETRLAAAVRQLAAGYLWFPKKALAGMALLVRSRAARRQHGLTEREWEVAALASRGLTNAQIADLLRIAESTVKFHLDNAYRKLGIHSREQIAGCTPALFA